MKSTTAITRPASPGAVLRSYLAERRESQIDVARALRCSKNLVNEIAQDKRGISVDTAIKLARHFDTVPLFWLHVQAKWDVWRTLQHKRFGRRTGEAGPCRACHGSGWSCTTCGKPGDRCRCPDATQEPMDCQECESTGLDDEPIIEKEGR